MDPAYPPGDTYYVNAGNRLNYLQGNEGTRHNYLRRN